MFSSGNNLPTFENSNANKTRKYECMHDFYFSKQNTYSFQKVFDFSDFQKKIENLEMLQTTTLKRNLVPEIRRG